MTMDTIGPPMITVPATQSLPALTTLTDTNEDPDVFEATMLIGNAQISFFPGQSANVLAYADAISRVASIPGPTFEVAAGTRVILHAVNQLDQPTSIHWHGQRLPGEMDGVPDMPVPAIGPGETYTYSFFALDPGLYWYHPHVRTDEQAERGLYGAFMVRGDAEPVVATERTLVLDDILLDEDGAIAPTETRLAHVVENGKMRMRFESMMGRQGNHLLVNGVSHPKVDVVPGAVERWRIVNTANARFFRLRLKDHVFRVIGSDAGLIAEPYEVEELLISNGERYDILVRLTGQPGETLELVNTHYNRGHDLADVGEQPLLALQFAGDPVQEGYPTYQLPLTPALAHQPPSKVLVLDESLNVRGRVDFMINNEIWPQVTALQASAGTDEVWEIQNQTHMDHPFHLHGNFFQPQGFLLPGTSQWQSYPRVVWKDTVLVAAQASVRIGVSYRGYAGHWMYHCHILEHAEAGMMGMVQSSADLRRCVPQTPTCEGDLLRICGPDGQTLQQGRFCASGCESLALGGGQCRPHCTPGDTRCVGQDLQQCDWHGDTWQSLQTCEGSCIETSDDSASCVPAP